MIIFGIGDYLIIVPFSKLIKETLQGNKVFISYMRCFEGLPKGGKLRFHEVRINDADFNFRPHRTGLRRFATHRSLLYVRLVQRIWLIYSINIEDYFTCQCLNLVHKLFCPPCTPVKHNNNQLLNLRLLPINLQNWAMNSPVSFLKSWNK